MPTLEDLTADIAARLHAVRGDLSDDAFEEMVRGIAETKMHFLALERDWALRRRTAFGRPSLAQAIGHIPTLPLPPKSCPSLADENGMSV